ncbi:antibiotic biosynthesis monooxygenase [Breoghania sp. JC706]|uniref:putative quinol monooxygenase n=1 Tax=Breoghania sp. JC706 TaxID=3117732 RepID=UPI00300B1C10
MTNVTILFHVSIRAERREDLVDALSVVAALSGEEDLCLAYDIYTTDRSKTDLVVVQTWETREGYETHNRLGYVGALFDRFENDLLEPVRRTILCPASEIASL